MAPYISILLKLSAYCLRVINGFMDFWPFEVVSLMDLNMPRMVFGKKIDRTVVAAFA